MNTQIETALNAPDGEPAVPPQGPESSNLAKKGFSIGRFVPIGVIGAGFIAFFAFGLDQYVSFEVLKTHRDTLMTWTEAHYGLAVLGFVALYIGVVALSLPVAVLFTPIAGFLFGTWAGGVYSVVAATVGASIIFLAARYACADVIEAKAGPTLRKMEDGFRENALSYLLVLRLVPLFPFWLVNLVPAALGVRLSTFIVGTAIGVIPGALIYASVGNGLGAVFAADGEMDLAIAFEPQVLLPLLGLATLSLVPIAYKKWKKASV